MARRGNVTLSWYVGKRAIHKQYAYGDVGWRRYFYTTDDVIMALQKDE
jgi:hypothetical protein